MGKRTKYWSSFITNRKVIFKDRKFFGLFLNKFFEIAEKVLWKTDIIILWKFVSQL